MEPMESSREAVPYWLQAACSSGDLAAVKYLLSISDNPEGLQSAVIFYLLTLATKNQQKNIVKYLLELPSSNKFPRDLIYLAISAGLDIYELYLAKNPEILTYEWQGLGDVVCITLTMHKVDFLTYLLDNAGADLGRSLASSRTGYVFLPLEWASYSSTESNVRLLLKHGAIIKGTCALQLAASWGKLGTVRLLIEAGAEINGTGDPNSISIHTSWKTNRTALHAAAETGHKKVVEYLMEHGAESKKLDGDGHTAMERAKHKGYDDIACLIRWYEWKR